MKQSVGLIILQIIGVSLGLVSVFWIAGSLPSEVYAIVGIYNVISTLLVVFSNTGFETYAIRNILVWKERGEKEKIQLLVTQAIIYRTLAGCIIFIPIIGYAAYISIYKFDNQYFSLFILMGLMSIAKATNDSVSLLLKAFNKYFESALVTYSVNVFGKIFALILFFRYGFNMYILIIVLLPIIVTIPVLFMMRDWIRFKGVFNIAAFKEGFNESKSFALSSYISYIYGFFDQLIVSIFMSPEILGSFTVAKNSLNIAKSFIENIFDPLIQNLISVKNNTFLLQKKLKKIFRIQNLLIILSILLTPFVILFIDELLSIINLQKYIYLNYFVIFIFLSQIVYIAMKVKFNVVMLFFSSRYYLKVTLIYAIMSLVFFITVMLINVKIVFLYILLTNLFMLFYTNFIYKKDYNLFINQVK